MKNAWQKRVAILCMLVAFSFSMIATAPITRALGETDQKATVSEQYPFSTDERKGAPSTPSQTADHAASAFEMPGATGASPAPTDAEGEATATPAPSEGSSPQPENSPGATDVQGSPEPTDTPVPTPDASAEADALATPEALSVGSLYLRSKHFATVGQTVTLELVLVADNAAGQSLSRFGVRFQTSADADFKVKAINQADTVRFVNQTLLVEGATVRGGRVTVAGEALTLKLSLQPFPEGSKATSAKVSIALLDGGGNEVGLKETDQDGARIDLSITYHLRGQAENPAEPEATAEPDETGTKTETPAPPANPDEPTAAPTEAPSLDLTVEPDAVTDQEPENTDGSAFASEEPPVTEEPTETPATEAPAENRQLALLASIPYDQLKVGDTLTLQAQMIGYEGLNLPIRIQWQQHTHGQWVNVEGATSDTLTVAITAENLHSAWRYSITIEQ